MKHLVFVVLMGLLLSDFSVAQLRTQAEKPPVNVRSGITTALPGTLAGYLNPDQFRMTNSYGMTFYSGGGHSGSVGQFTNSMFFKVSEPLFLRVDLGVMHEPFGPSKSQNAQFMHGAELIYQPNSRFQMNVGYSVSPYYSGLGMYQSPFAPQQPSTLFDQKP